MHVAIKSAILIKNLVCIFFEKNYKMGDRGKYSLSIIDLSWLIPIFS